MNFLFKLSTRNDLSDMFFCLLFKGVLFLRSDAQPWNCAAAERCALSLERDFEETIANKNDSFTINFCL